MTWIKLDKGIYAESATPDPAVLVESDKDFEALIVNKEQESNMYAEELKMIIMRKEEIDAEIKEMKSLTK